MKKSTTICTVMGLVLCLMVTMPAGSAWAYPQFFEAWPSNMVEDPLTAISGQIGHGASAATASADAAMDVYVTAAEDDWEAPNTLVPVQMQVFPGNDTWEPNAFFDVTYGGTAGSYAVDSFFDITFEIEAVSGGPTPSLHAAPTVDFAVDSFFDITYQIDFSDGAYSVISLHGEPGPEMGMSLTDVFVTSDLPNSFFDVFVELDIPDLTVGREDTMMIIGMTGSYTPEPATLTLLALGGLAVLRRRRKQ